MGFMMRRRLKSFLPIVLMALIVQIFAPIGATWAASIAASDPLGVAVICHGNAASGQTDQSGGHTAPPRASSGCNVLPGAPPGAAPPTAHPHPLRPQARAACRVCFY